MSQVSKQLTDLQLELQKTRDLTHEMAQRQQDVVIPMIENLNRNFAKLSAEIDELVKWKEGWEIRFKTVAAVTAIIGGVVVWLVDRVIRFFFR